MSDASLDLSVVIVSFNTRDVLRRCLVSLYQEMAATPQVHTEVLIVDNNSRDGSPDMVRAEFPQVRLIDAGSNLGFAAANNLAFRQCSGRYIMQLNSDAFMQPGALRLCIEHMDANPLAAVGGARLIGEDGELQPSARRFPTPFYEVLMQASWVAIASITATGMPSAKLGRTKTSASARRVRMASCVSGPTKWTEPSRPRLVV